MRTPNQTLARVLIVAYASGLIPSAAAAQTARQTTPRQMATVTANAPIYIGAAVSPTPLRVAAPGTILKVLQQQDDWIQVEFSDPQWGPRVGWVQRSLLKLSAEDLQPMDLSVRDAPPVAALPSSRPQAPSAAQQSASQASGDETVAAGMVDGEAFAESIRTGGKVGLGVCVGVLTGLIGTGIGYFVTGPESMTTEAHQRCSSKSPDYQLGFKSGWDKKTQSKKRNAFLVGGLLGTAAFVVLSIAATSSSR
jgi:hypothetical protein